MKNKSKTNNNAKTKREIETKSETNNQNEFLKKIANNKLLLFLVPNLICWYQLLYYYNQNAKLILSVFYYEIIIGCVVFLGINTLVYFLLQKFLKDRQKVFCLMCIISVCYSISMNKLAFIIFLIVVVIAIIDFKFLIRFSLDSVISLVSFIVVILFSFSFITSIYNVCYLTLKSKSYDYKMKFEVDEEKSTPNIYWIHCDGMMNMSDINKYFGENYENLKDYFKNNKYFYNDDASLATGHKTVRSLAALFNPYYYDNFYEEYLEELEEQYLIENKNTKFIVNYYELEEKRLNNELFNALSEKNYETIVVGDYSPYTSFYVDHYYDYYHYLGLGDPKQELRYFKKGDNNELQLKAQIRLTHSGLLFANTILNHVVNNMSFLNYQSIDYKNFDFDDYSYTKDTPYWYSKAVFKALDDSYDENKSQFTFIDYKLTHYPLTFNSKGEFLTPTEQYELDSYFENYVYASNLLFELLDYIKSIDKDAIIIVQGDHGIHTFEDSLIMDELDINRSELQEIRNSVINAVYVPKKYRNGDEDVLGNPLNISRYLVNNFVGENYEYID